MKAGFWWGLRGRYDGKSDPDLFLRYITLVQIQETLPHNHIIFLFFYNFPSTIFHYKILNYIIEPNHSPFCFRLRQFCTI